MSCDQPLLDQVLNELVGEERRAGGLLVHRFITGTIMYIADGQHNRPLIWASRNICVGGIP